MDGPHFREAFMITPRQETTAMRNITRLEDREQGLFAREVAFFSEKPEPIP